VKRTTILSAVGIGSLSGIAGYVVGGAYPHTVSLMGGEEPITGKIVVDFPAVDFDPQALAASICGGSTKIAKLDATTFLAVETIRFDCAR
jgi:hypothetical protein